MSRFGVACLPLVATVALLLHAGACSVDEAAKLPPGTVVNPAVVAPPGPMPGAAGQGPADMDGGTSPTEPEPKQAEDGQSCDEDGECKSGHCDRGLCCSGGRCCKSADDCGQSADATCEDPAECQGARGTVACRNNRCRVQDGSDDDSACDTKVEANDCGFYKPVMCNGKADQTVPECPTSCSEDAECDKNARCRNEECIEAEPNGGACEMASDCASRHCSRGICCEEGDCCTRASDCPASYASAATCSDEEHCQGQRGEPSCVESMCQTTMVDDDRACLPRVRAVDCSGSTPDVFCTGAVDQQESRDCESNCRWDGDCPAGEHCAQNTCIEDLPNGEACDRAAACDSSYCGGSLGQPRFCCEEGACCRTDENCIGRFVCDDRADCQGTRFEQVCNDAFTCEDDPDGDSEPNDSGCWGQISSTCGSNRDAICSIAADQIPPWCVNGGSGRCSSASDCDSRLECRDGFCQRPED